MGRTKVFFGIFLAIITSVCMQMVTSACTAVYVGKDVSKDGDTIIARSVEWLPGYMSYVESVEAKKHKKGEYIEDPMSGLKYEYPKQTYKYILGTTMDYAEDGKTTDVCINEYGLAVSATVSAYANEKALKADPLVEDGISEGSISLILGSSCKSAKEAVELLCSIVDEYGSADSNIILIADQTESWYVELYTGHQYAAIKMPEDKVSVVCNQFMLRSFDTKDKDIYYSKDLVNLAKKNKFAVFEKDGCINLFETYADGVNYYNYPRVWKGQKMLMPGKSSAYDPEEIYPLFFEPDKKVSFEDVAEIFRSEYDEDDEFNVEDDEYIGPISRSTVNAMHIVEINDDLPAEMADVLWLCNAPTKYGQFVPISNAVDKIPKSYSTNLSEREFVAGVAACEFNRLTGICILNPDYIGKKVVAYNTGIEKANRYAFDKQMQEWSKEYKKSPSKVKKSITRYCSDIMEESVNDARNAYDEASWYLAAQNYPYYTVKDAKAVKSDYSPYKTFELCFDFGRIASKYDWSVKQDKEKLTATKDGKTITVSLGEPEPYNNDHIDWKTGEVLVSEEERKNSKPEAWPDYVNNIVLRDDNTKKEKRYATYVKNKDGKTMTFVNLFSIFE